MPCRVGAELAEEEDGERRGADAVGVVVAVDADSRPTRDSVPDRLDRGGHVAERKGIVAGQGALEEGAGRRRVVVPAPDEHRGRRPAEAELGRELAHARLRLRVSYSQAAVDRYVRSLAHRYNRGPKPAKVIGANAQGPIIRAGKVGLAVEQATLREAVEQQLASGARGPLVLLMD